MARTLRWIAIGLGALVVLLVLGAVVIYLRFDPQIIGPRLAAAIEQSTGRKAAVGKISLKLFPAPAISVTPLSLANAGAPGDMLRIESLAIRVHPMPLLSGRLDFGAITIDRPTLAIYRDRAGRWNFSDILEHAARTRQAAPPGAPAAGGGFAISVAEAKIRDGRLQIFDDAVSPGQRVELTLAPIDATVSGWGLGRTTSLDLSVGLGRSVLRSTGAIEGSGAAQTLTVKLPSSRLGVGDVALLFPWLGVARPAGLALGGAVSVSGRAALAFDKIGAMQFEGTAALENVSYKDATMKRPVEKIGGVLKVTGDRAQWDDFQAVFGDSDLAGRLEVQDFGRPRIGFNLHSTRLDLNQLMDIFGGGAAPGGAPGGGGVGVGLNVTARGSLAVRAMRFQNFDLADAQGEVKLERAALSLENLRGRFYGGAVRGALRVDLSRAAPHCTVESALEGVDVNAAASAYDPAFKDLLHGTLAGNLKIEADGLAMKPLLDTARGSARLEIAKGALTSISMMKTLAVLLAAAGGKGIGQDQTPFESLRGSFAIGGGKATTNDLTLNSADLDMTAQGVVGLDASLDLEAAPSFSVAATKGMVEKTPKLAALVDPRGRLTVHLIVKGTLGAPSVNLDLAAQTQGLREKAKEKLQEKLQDKLREGLKGLFKR